jgi:hypothetical protein
VREEHGACVGVDRERVARPIVFLVLARDLVLLDHAAVVVVDVATADHADLADLATEQLDLLPVRVQGRRRLA